MKTTKRLFLITLSIYTLFTCIPKVFAGKKITRVLAIGTEDSQKKFAKNLFRGVIPIETLEVAFKGKFNEKKENSSKGPAFSEDYLKDNIQIQILKDYTENKEKIKGFIKEKLLKIETVHCIHNENSILSGVTWYDFGIILATVDVDQEPEKVKEDIKNIVEFICDDKDAYTQVIVVGCSDTAVISEPIFSNLSNYVTKIEQVSTPNKWGTEHDREFEEQFLGFFGFPINTEKNAFYSFLLENVKNYDFLKEQRTIWKKIKGFTYYSWKKFKDLYS